MKIVCEETIIVTYEVEELGDDATWEQVDEELQDRFVTAYSEYTDEQLVEIIFDGNRSMDLQEILNCTGACTPDVARALEKCATQARFVYVDGVHDYWIKKEVVGVEER